jgi:replication initiation protein RepC
MEPALPTTPFGRRSLSLAQIASQMVAKQRPPEAVAHKWNIFRALCTARSRLGLSERSLTVLNALLTFHPETVLSGDDLVVFPSNEQIALRAHGMPSSTMRRHLAQLVDAGLLIRRDSPNGKRYARKGREGAISQAFGFDLSPLVARADEIMGLAEAVIAEQRAYRYARERITLARRDIVKMIETGIEEEVPPPIGQGASTWESVNAHYRAMVSRIPANASLQALEEAGGALTALAADLTKTLENHIKESNLGAKGARNEHHIQTSNPKPPIDLEPSLPEGPGPKAEPPRKQPEPAERAFPLGMVLSACPDIVDYAKGGISHWRDLLAAAAVVRGMLGISPSAWEEAQSVMGELQAAIVIACLLQRSATISSPGGYLRELTRKAGVGEFSLGPILMAQINARNRERKSA